MDNKKDLIIQAALKRFSHYGFNKTTMSEIAVDLNITKANLYYYYPDKNALIKDVLVYISEDILRSQYAIVEEYDSNLVDTLTQLLEKRASFLRDYYVLHISENLEWIKGQGVGTVLEAMHGKDIEMMTALFEKAVAAGEVDLENARQDATCYIEVIKGLSLIRSIADVLSGMPNAYNVDEILESQKCTTRFIFRNKLISNN
ncbi:TetR/AcrR family transcriptional regulator [Sphingobacterium oryzagri]|uniref:TetR/AcrR family transcriptional regulator n=1 Tax=Sphingobacterium oryzagri TaxID=3025669 RepID=A0ABY7WPC6_9SPHI|nr:TetR/AcrR family transcriptional regulator [Sphingobacterium sp. KACC 22765]WDF70404.1 TetR/AcrR family transcriptional regulator [Sphingobacterium sp. KACC 22765]